MTLKTIRLELARTPDFPEGSDKRGYEFVAPLGDDDHIDVDVWHDNKQACTVHRFWQGEDAEDGFLIHTRHRTWAFSYAPGEEDDEPFFRFEYHAFREGEYVSITEHDGVVRPFKVVSVG